MMFDEEMFKSSNKDDNHIQKLMLGFEALAWLHNCQKIQCGKGMLSHDFLKEFGFFMVIRSHKLFYSKSK